MPRGSEFSVSERTSESTVMMGTRPPLRLTSCTACKGKYGEKAEVQVGGPELFRFLGPKYLSSTEFAKFNVGLASISRKGYTASPTGPREGAWLLFASALQSVRMGPNDGVRAF